MFEFGENSNYLDDREPNSVPDSSFMSPPVVKVKLQEGMDQVEQYRRGDGQLQGNKSRPNLKRRVVNRFNSK